MKVHEYTQNGKVLILKRIPTNRIGYDNFKYPSGVGTEFEPITWDPSPDCGGGIHGWPWGFGLGDGSTFDIIDDIWLILSASPEDVVGELEDGLKCKAKKVRIEFEGSFHDAFTTVAKEWSNIINKLNITNNPETNINSKILASSEGHHDLSSSGNCNTLVASGRAKLTASGQNSRLVAVGSCSQLSATGDGSVLAAVGYNSSVAASGYGSNLAACGRNSNLAASGYGSKLAASGFASNVAASGNDTMLAAVGNDSVCAVAGVGGKVKVGKRGAFALTYYNINENRYKIVVGEEGINGIQSNTWYSLDNDGKIIEVK